MMNMHKRYISRRCPCTRQGGFTLFEVMIAVLILAVGLLGMAGLQGTGIRNNHSAYLRSQATIFAYDIIDRMRVNRPTALGGSYALAWADTPAAPGTNCHANACTGVEFAAFDLFEWTQTLANELPSGDGSITSLNVGGRTIFRVIVRWDDTRGQGGPIDVQIEAEV